MNSMLAERIVADPDNQVGSPFVRDTGIRVTQVLDALADHPDAASVIQVYPELEMEDVQASIEFAREAIGAGTRHDTGQTIASLGWTVSQASGVRLQLQAFADDWDDPSMDVYDAQPRSR